MFNVTLRLGTGDEADAGMFDDRDAAGTRVKELIAAADAGQWLDLGNRYVRAEAVVSIDVHEGRAPSWKGSDSRQ